MQKMLLMNFLCSWLLIIVVVLHVDIVHGGVGPENCTAIRCKRHGPEIRFPFRLKGVQPIHCGYPGFDVSCTKDKQTVLEITPSSADKFLLNRINYTAQEIEIYLYNNHYDYFNDFKDICIPRQIFDLSSSPFHYSDAQTKNNYTLFSCPPSDERDRYPSFCPLAKLSPCGVGNHSNNKIYALDFSCSRIEWMPQLVSCTKVDDYMSVPDIWGSVKLKWSRPLCKRCEEKGQTCRLQNQVADDQTTQETECLEVPKGPNRGRQALKILGICALVTVLIGAGTVIYYVYSSKKIEEENQLRIEKFLDDYRALKPSRYSYDDIKRITNQFEDKLGQGGYGTVFKGKVSSELLVAVKILDSSNDKGEDFINEVGTMGLIHHVNVVRLVGFCADGFIRALVYEYLPNGSLQNFLSSADDKNSFLGWEKLQDIALGIAKGIEYLHQGCDQRILHFDIKPNNILLDLDFTPKVSDFGLAKLCSKDQSAISMTTARGTMGYIAPEVYSRNFGNVSYKSDVYSFGTLLLEMVGGKKKFRVMEDCTNHIYFPEWIYNLLEQGSDLRIHIEDNGVSVLILISLALSLMASSVRVMLLLIFPLIMINVKAKTNDSISNVISLGASLSPNVNNLSASSWLSSSGRFAFGFYPQGNGFAVGIQLLNQPLLQNTVVWTANRDDPPVSSNSTLTLTRDGLLLRTEGGPDIPITYGQSSLATTSSSNSSTGAAAMLDSGNFVLYNGSRVVLWESFGFPTDTILGGQDLKSGMSLVSSVSVSDHSTGRFFLKMQTDGNLVAYPANSSDAYWVIYGIGQLNLNLSGFLVENSRFSDDTIRVVANGSYHRPQDNQTTLYRATLDYDGNFRLYLHNFLMTGSAARVMVLWSALQDPCDAKGICGFNSYCQVAKASQDVECKCYPGFVYNNASDKSLGCYHKFTQNGCTRNEEPRLQYKVEALDNMWWQNYAYSVTDLNKENCSNSCLEDCSCWAVLYTDAAECRKYKLPLLYGKRSSNISSRGFIKVLVPRNISAMPNHFPHLTKNSTVIESKNDGLILILSISLGSIAFLCFIFAISSFSIYMHRVHRYESLMKHSNLALADQEYFTLKSFSYTELEITTDGFKEEIGRGTFGAVYKGTLSGGASNKNVAVKRLEKVVEEGVREFKAEITTIGRTHHRNLVQLLGFCIEGSRKLLVYEYMSNGSLADLLFNAKGVHPSWKERVGLVFDVAKGVLYLHDECSVHIIHSNLKPQNILLDHTRTAKISDFGLARLVPNETKINSTQGGGGVEQVRRGYLAPEWQKNALISVKADIYSFGIVLLEIVCCRRNIELNVSTPDEIVLSSWVSKCFAAGEIGKLVEEDENVDLKTLERMIKVGLWCVQHDPALRPFMKNVILMLEGTMDIPVPPCPELPSLV